MKPKLLITLGDSWTMGQGTDNPREDGWPPFLGKTLGFDKLLNFGKAGASNSGQVKLFYDYINENDLSGYDVLVIFLMTVPTRFSFYIDGKVKNYLIDYNPSDIQMGYIKEIQDIEIDSTLEQVFFIRSLEQLCINKGFDLLLTTWTDNFSAFFNLYGSTTRHLFKRPMKLLPPKNKELTYYAPCSHPNKKGYEWMGNEMIQGIKENHSRWYSDKPNPNIEMEWLGDYQINLQSTII
jgi:hypothetical protein